MDAIIMDTPEQINFARMAYLKSALKLECLGLKRRGQSAYAICKKEYGLKGSKEAVLEQMKAMVKQALGE